VQPLLGIATLGENETERLSLITPWMANGDLMSYLSTRKDVSRRKMIEGIACGMQYLHAQDIVHADLRGENVLVDDSGSPRITDFGLSRLRSTQAYSTQLSFTSGGTQRFQAPELMWPASFQGDGTTEGGIYYCTGDPTTRSDVYALAMTCIQVFTGDAPFQGLREQQIMFAVVNADTRPKRPVDALGELHDDHWRLIQRAWARHPKDRLDMSAFAELWKVAGNWP